jgi:hypothetical protein
VTLFGETRAWERKPRPPLVRSATPKSGSRTSIPNGALGRHLGALGRNCAIRTSLDSASPTSAPTRHQVTGAADCPKRLSPTAEGGRENQKRHLTWEFTTSRTHLCGAEPGSEAAAQLPTSAHRIGLRCGRGWRTSRNGE